MKHLRDNNETYFSHMLFAGKAGVYLLVCGVVFILHGLLPLTNVPERFNFLEIKRKCKEWSDYTIERLFD